MQTISKMMILKSLNSSFQNVACKTVLLMIFCTTLICEQNKVIAASLFDPESTTSYTIIENEIPHNEFSEVCTTPICQQEASFYLNLMNQEVDPCDNFYQFACGNFIKIADIPKDSNRIAVVETVKKKIDQQLLTEVQSHKPDDSATFKKLKTLYQNCVRDPDPENVQLTLDLLNEFGGMPLLLGEKWNEESFDWLESTLKSYNYGVPPAFPAISFTDADLKNTSKFNLNIAPPRTRMNSKFFMNDSDKKLLEAYRNYMIDIMVLLGANESVATEEMTDCFNFEVKLYKIKSPPQHFRNITAAYNPMKIKNLSELCPNIPWLEYLNRVYSAVNVTFDDNEVVIVRDPAAMKELGKLMSKTPKKLLANYLMWQVVFELVEFLPYQFADRLQAFLSVYGGIQERQSRTTSCIKDLMNAAPLGMSALYVQKFINKGSRENATALIQTMKSHFGKMLKEIEWMDNNTKKSALEKLDAMDVFVGYYPEYFDNAKIDKHYESVKIENGSYMVNIFNWSRFNKFELLSIQRNPIEMNRWTTPTHTAAVINAYFIDFLNKIDIAASLLQQPFYHLERPQYLNYGVLGYIVGHEITHGFDSEGRRLDKRGNKMDWWEPSTQQQFIEKSKCFVDRYSNYTVAEIGLRINGEQTLRENIADFGGFKVAYGAYVDWANRNNITEPQLPGLNYTPQQMYWISLASFFCGKFNKESLTNQVLLNSHSPREARVVVTMSNLPEFADDFSCKPNTNMNPSNKCNLW